MGYKFYCIIYPSCVDFGNHLDTKENFLNQIAQKKLNETVDRGNKNFTLKPLNEIDMQLKMTVYEVCYVYGPSNNYCFTIKHSFASFLANYIGYSEEGINALESIENDSTLCEQQKKHFQYELMAVIKKNQNIDIEQLKLKERKLLSLTDSLIKQLEQLWKYQPN